MKRVKATPTADVPVIHAESLSPPEITKQFVFEALCVYCPIDGRGQYASYEELRQHIEAEHADFVYRWPPRT